MNVRGEPIRGIIRSSDASSTPAAATWYRNGSTTAITIGTGDVIEIYELNGVAAATGDLRIFMDVDAGDDLDAGEDIVRLTPANNGGIEKTFPVPFTLPPGVNVKALAAAGVLDVQIVATLRRGESTGRPSWKENNRGG